MPNRQVDVTVSAIDRLTGPAERMRAALQKLTAPIRSVSGASERLAGATGATVLAKRFQQLGTRVSDVSGRMMGLLGTLSAISGVSIGAGLLAGGAVAKSFVTTNAEFEQFLTSLETLTGSSDKAKGAMTWITNFAAKTPYELAEVTQGFIKLKSAGIDATDGTLKAVGDMASAMSMPLERAIEAFADAQRGQMERMLDFGVVGSTKGDILEMAFTDKDGRQRVFSAAKNDTKALQKTLLQIIAARGFTDAMDKQSLTFNGIVSNLKDQWSGFLRAIGDAGAFDFLKTKLAALLDQVNAWAQDGTLQRWASEISDALINLWVVIESKIMAVDWGAAWESFSASVSTVMERINAFVGYVGGWENALLVVVAVMNAGLIASIVSLGVTLAAALPAIIAFAASASAAIVSAVVAISSAILLNPIGLAITAIVLAVAGLAYAVYDNWGPLSAFVANLWTTITGYFETAVAWFDGLDLGAVGMSIINSLLDGLKGAWAGVTGWVSGAMSSLGTMLPGFVRDQLGIKDLPVEPAPTAPPGPRFAQSNRPRSPIFAPAAAAAAAGVMATGTAASASMSPLLPPGIFGSASPEAYQPPARMAETLAGAKVPNVWDLVSGEAVPPRADAASAAPSQISAPVSITVNASGVTDVAAIEKLVQDAADAALRDWQRQQTSSQYGLLAD